MVKDFIYQKVALISKLNSNVINNLLNLENFKSNSLHGKFLNFINNNLKLFLVKYINKK